LVPSESMLLEHSKMKTVIYKIYCSLNILYYMYMFILYDRGHEKNYHIVKVKTNIFNDIYNYIAV